VQHKSDAEELERSVKNNVLAGHPLVGFRQLRRGASRALAHDPKRSRQVLYCMGFHPDFFLSPRLAAKWRSMWYPIHETKESFDQWTEFIAAMIQEHLGPWDDPEGAGRHEDAFEQDLTLLREHHPNLVRTSSAKATPGPSQTSAKPEEQHPVAYCLNWVEILHCLDINNTEENRRSIRQLNEQFGGPIITPRKGGQPKVVRHKLLEWWRGLEIQFQDYQHQKEGKRESTAETYQYGREAVVTPLIAGHVKKRRASNRRSKS
jgi:hypothetical protein